jgi:hypothetical protein
MNITGNISLHTRRNTCTHSCTDIRTHPHTQAPTQVHTHARTHERTHTDLNVHTSELNKTSWFLILIVDVAIHDLPLYVVDTYVLGLVAGLVSLAALLIIIVIATIVCRTM